MSKDTIEINLSETDACLVIKKNGEQTIYIPKQGKNDITFPNTITMTMLAVLSEYKDILTKAFGEATARRMKKGK